MENNIGTVGNVYLNSWQLVSFTRSKEITLHEAAKMYKKMIKDQNLIIDNTPRIVDTITCICSYCGKNYELHKYLFYVATSFFCNRQHKHLFNKKLKNRFNK